MKIVIDTNLLAKVKTTPIENHLLADEYYNIEKDLSSRLNGQFDIYLKEQQSKIQYARF